jgi:hypothetical protein
MIGVKAESAVLGQLRDDRSRNRLRQTCYPERRRGLHRDTRILVGEFVATREDQPTILHHRQGGARHAVLRDQRCHGCVEWIQTRYRSTGRGSRAPCIDQTALGPRPVSFNPAGDYD